MQRAAPDTPEFKKWFGDSKAVDDDGAPKVVYHGTGDDITAFDLDHPSRKDTGWLGTGVYVTTDPSIASAYSSLKAKPDGGQNVLPLYAKLENPYNASMDDKRRLQAISHNQGADAGRQAADEWTKELRAKGHDGVILQYEAKDVGKANASKEMVVFDPAGVKSAFNQGTFDPATPDIRLQRDAEESPPVEQPTPDSKVKIRLNRRFDEERQGVRGDIEKIGRDVFGKNFRFELAESITAPGGEMAQGAFDPESRMAYIALRADEEGMSGTLAHEGIHFLRNAGAFSNEDGTPTQAWQTLEGQAPQWRKDYGIDARYEGDVGGKDDAQRERLMNEEAIAEAFADFQTRGAKTGFRPGVRRALTQIKRFFRQVASGLKGGGFKTWEDIFEGDIASGKQANAPTKAKRPSPRWTATYRPRGTVRRMSLRSSRPRPSGPARALRSTGMACTSRSHVMLLNIIRIVWASLGSKWTGKRLPHILSGLGIA